EKPSADPPQATSSSAEEATTGPPVQVQALEPDFIDFHCPYCQSSVSFPKADSGRLRQCPNCLESMIVPESGRQAERIPFSIRTERLVLRRLQTLDAKDLADLMSNPDTLRYLAWTPMNLEDAEDWIAGQSRVRFPLSNKYCHLAVEEVQR